MEAARQLAVHPLRDRHRRQLESELQELRGLGEIFLMRRFDGSISGPDAEDAVAEVIIRLQAKIEAGAEIRNLRAVFFTSTRNAAIDQLRSRTARPTVDIEAVAEMPAAEPTPVEIAEADEEKVRLRETLARMRPNYREAIVLRFGVGLTVPEIAERLAISLPAAKKLVLRATEQARKRLAAIDGRDFCPEIRTQAQRLLVNRDLAGVCEESERRLLEAHLEHCGHCKSFVAELHRNLNELGGALLAGGAATQADAHVAFIDRLASVLDSATGAAQAAAAKARLATYKLGGALQSGDGGASAALAGSAGKAIAVCGAATATTACVATGVIGPGLGVGALNPEKMGDERPAPIERTVEPAPEEVPVVVPTPEPTPVPEPEPEAKPAEQSEPTTEPVEEEPTPTPDQESAEQFGFESSAPPPEPPPPPPAPSSSARPSSSGGGEQFGFGG